MEQVPAGPRIRLPDSPAAIFLMIVVLPLPGAPVSDDTRPWWSFMASCKAVAFDVE
jgi:hypothetical protein